MADRVVFTPTGQKLLNDTVKIEYLNFAPQDYTYGWLTYGFGTNYEIELYGENLDTKRIVNGLNFSYNLFPAFKDTTPGISFGVIDLLGDTEDGRAFYAAFTFELQNYDPGNQDVPTELSFGFWSGRQGLIFANARMPFSEKLWLLAEHDSRSINAGVEVRPIDEARIRLLFRDGRPGFGLALQKRF